MPSILAGTRIRKYFSRARSQAEGVIQFAMGKQPGIGGDHGAAKLQLQATVEIEADPSVLCFTRGVRDRCLARSPIRY